MAVEYLLEKSQLVSLRHYSSILEDQNGFELV